MLAKRMPSAPGNSYIAVLGEESLAPAMNDLAPGDRKLLSRYDYGVSYDVDGAEINMPGVRVNMHQILAANAPVLIHANGSAYGSHETKDRIMELIYELYKSPKEPVMPTKSVPETAK